MNDQQKAQAYDNLMMEHRRLDNQISQIRSENFELNEQQQNQVNQLRRKQEELFFKMKTLFE